MFLINTSWGWIDQKNGKVDEILKKYACIFHLQVHSVTWLASYLCSLGLSAQVLFWPWDLQRQQWQVTPASFLGPIFKNLDRGNSVATHILMCWVWYRSSVSLQASGSVLSYGFAGSFYQIQALCSSVLYLLFVPGFEFYF